MFVRVDVEAATFELVEPEDCGRFHVEAVNGDAVQVAGVLGDAISGGDHEHVWLLPSAVQALHPGRNEAWDADFAGMVGYASSKGWVDDQGGVRAHIEAASPDTSG